MKNYRNYLKNCVPAVLLLALSASPVAAQNFFGTQNIETGLNSKSVTFQGQIFVNQGLVGAGRVAATARDFHGDSLGSFSGMAIDLSTWRKTSNGYSAILYTLPDRGYNDADFSNYAARINVFNLSFTPYSGSTLPQDARSQNQVTLTYSAARSFFLTDFNGNKTTGEDPQNGTIIQNGYTLPVVPNGLEGAGKVSIDAEALTFASDGSFYVADEYSAGIYHFNSQGKMIGFIAPPAAILPKSSGNVNYTGLAEPTTSGRRNNQGMEAASITPDGNKLFTVLQSATVQDSTSSQQTRLNTRVMIYDISQNATPANPVGHYALQLPTFDRDGTNGSADRTAAQSEILALNDNQFLLLTRDGNGVDNGDTRPIVFKSIYLVDVSGATNLAGTTYETSATPISPGGVLSSSITAVKSIQFVNMLNIDQLTRFGLNYDADLSNLSRTNNSTTLSEKWEAMALAPVLEEANPQDFFLFVGNDNDFITTDGVMVGDAQYSTYSETLNNDSMLLVYRVTLPTYVDSQYLSSMIYDGALNVSVLGAGLDDIGQNNSINIAAHLDGDRQNKLMGIGSSDDKFSIWGGIGSTSSDTDFNVDMTDYTIGFGYKLNSMVELGIDIGSQKNESGGGFYSYDAEASKYSVYAGIEKDGFFSSLSYTKADVDFNDITRPAAYGLLATGTTNAESTNINFEIGKLFKHNNFAFGPLAGIRKLDGDIDGYTETGASGGNVTYDSVSYSNTEMYAGAELVGRFGSVVPSLRITYVSPDADFGAVNAHLSSALSAAGTASLNITDFTEDEVNADIAISGAMNNVAWRIGYNGNMGVDSNDWSHRIGLSLGYSF